MNLKDVKYELQNILQGKNAVSHGELIQTIANYLRKCTKAVEMAERNEPNKKEETKELIHFINSKVGVSLNLMAIKKAVKALAKTTFK